MNISLIVLCAIAGYLIGSISFARLMGYLVAPGEELGQTSIAVVGSDLRFETDTVSATAVSALKGPAFGLTVAVLDMLKAAVPLWFLQQRFVDQPAIFLLFSVMVVLGHNYPVYHKFHGGRGLSPIMGSYFVLDWVSIVIAIALSSVFGFAVFKKFFLGYAGWIYLMIPAFLIRFNQPEYAISAAVIAIIFTIASIPEFQLLRKFEDAGIKPEDLDLEGFESWNIQNQLNRFRKN